MAHVSCPPEIQEPSTRLVGWSQDEGRVGLLEVGRHVHFSRQPPVPFPLPGGLQTLLQDRGGEGRPGVCPTILLILQCTQASWLPKPTFSSRGCPRETLGRGDIEKEQRAPWSRVMTQVAPGSSDTLPTSPQG